MQQTHADSQEPGSLVKLAPTLPDAVGVLLGLLEVRFKAGAMASPLRDRDLGFKRKRERLLGSLCLIQVLGDLLLGANHEYCSVSVSGLGFS
jgi:hypothetical protein